MVVQLVPPPEDRLLRADEAAHRLGISPRQVWRLAAAGHLEVVRINRSARFRLRDVVRLIDEGASR